WPDRASLTTAVRARPWFSVRPGGCHRPAGARRQAWSGTDVDGLLGGVELRHLLAGLLLGRLRARRLEPAERSVAGQARGRLVDLHQARRHLLGEGQRAAEVAGDDAGGQ